jgi:hypothetical protein
MFRLYLSHLQALKKQIHTVNEHCIVGFPTLIIYRENNDENIQMRHFLWYTIIDKATHIPVCFEHKCTLSKG